jgi:hypothetical protein
MAGVEGTFLTAGLILKPITDGSRKGSRPLGRSILLRVPFPAVTPGSSWQPTAPGGKDWMVKDKASLCITHLYRQSHQWSQPPMNLLNKVLLCMRTL